MGELNEARKSLAVADERSSREASARGRSDRDERHKKGAVPSPVLRQEHRVFDSFTQAHVGAFRTHSRTQGPRIPRSAPSVSNF